MSYIVQIILKVFSLIALRYFVIAGVAFFLVYRVFKHRLKKNKIQERDAKRSDFSREILHSIQTIGVFAIIDLIVLRSPLKQYTWMYNDFQSYPIWWFLLSLLLCFVLHDTYFYWMHRLLHHPKIFKFAHLLHHRSTNPSPWASYSFHFIEAWTEGGILLILVFIMPLHPATLVLFTAGSLIINVYGHLGYEILPRRFIKSPLFQFLNTSVHHNLHHKKLHGNYGLYFRVWDRLMGTEHVDYVKEFKTVHLKRFGILKILK